MVFCCKNLISYYLFYVKLYEVIRASGKEMAPRVLAHPGTRPTEKGNGTVDEIRIPTAGDPFYTTSPRAQDDVLHGCIAGVVYIGHLIEGVNGEEVEVIDAVQCRRCAPRGSDPASQPATPDETMPDLAVPE